ncbi:uncharacterized protein STEHIDRAFT_109594 [Stereum hirsutum FP-91666 SS1]|uniref:uncharacterized protein n=1 Tax=Stereum hirsutum (strain FP-91666) TaxID=721885 RepID=UPI000440DE1A|nr:uncharacterized protein STEHIDRAFT_109594 [Stereum hirsutum FP-91666 SS1]EIM89407.1 hypothetical protein STEHIDRAFT_109594 [Stereum hirsutum FP-91666 SS1]
MSSQVTSNDKDSTRVLLTEEQAQNLRRCVEILSPVVKDLVEDALKACLFFDIFMLILRHWTLFLTIFSVHWMKYGRYIPGSPAILAHAVIKFEACNGASPEIHQKLFPIAKETFDYLSEAKSECDYEEYNRLNPIQLFAPGPVFSEAVTQELEAYRYFTDRGMI